MAKSKLAKDLRIQQHKVALAANFVEKNLLFNQAEIPATEKGIDRETVYDGHLYEIDELKIATGKEAIFTPEFLAEIEARSNETLAEYFYSVLSTNARWTFVLVSKLLQLNPCCIL